MSNHMDHSHCRSSGHGNPANHPVRPAAPGGSAHTRSSLSNESSQPSLAGKPPSEKKLARRRKYGKQPDLSAESVKASIQRKYEKDPHRYARIYFSVFPKQVDTHWHDLQIEKASRCTDPTAKSRVRLLVKSKRRLEERHARRLRRSEEIISEYIRKRITRWSTLNHHDNNAISASDLSATSTKTSFGSVNTLDSTSSASFSVDVFGRIQKRPSQRPVLNRQNHSAVFASNLSAASTQTSLGSLESLDSVYSANTIPTSAPPTDVELCVSKINALTSECDRLRNVVDKLQREKQELARKQEQAAGDTNKTNVLASECDRLYNIAEKLQKEVQELTHKYEQSEARVSLLTEINETLTERCNLLTNESLKSADPSKHLMGSKKKTGIISFFKKK